MHTLSLDSPLSYFEELAERLPNGQSTILPNLGHLLVMEDPKRTGTPGCARSGSAEKALILGMCGGTGTSSELDPRVARP